MIVSDLTPRALRQQLHGTGLRLRTGPIVTSICSRLDAVIAGISLHYAGHPVEDAAGFADFWPDACLINRYLPGARLTLHQDKNERDYGAPIVSVSLGMAATFLFGGLKRSAAPPRGHAVERRAAPCSRKRTNQLHIPQSRVTEDGP